MTDLSRADLGRPDVAPALPGPEALLARVPSLAGTPRQITALPGGLTNQNFKVTTPDGQFVARVFADGGDLLAIDREREYCNSMLAAAAGVGAPVVEYRPQERILVLRFINGKTLTNADVGQPAMLRRIAAACKTLHSAGRFTGDFDMFEIQASYYATAMAAGMRIPVGYDDLMPAFMAARQALAVHAEGTVPCNNDLLAANFIDDGERIWLIDYEYSGNNDPCFELGNIAGECRLDADALADLVTAYYGRARRSRIARARLFGLAGQYGWTLWGAIQHSASQLDFDFWSWAMERFDGAAAGFRGPGFRQLLTDAQDED
ncbi:MAG: phosphotransferase [Streptosporangiaceae bacterium]